MKEITTMIANDNEPEATSSRDGGLITQKSFGSEMTMDEFADWLSDNNGNAINEALQQGAFMLCCDVISQDIGKATLRLREKTSAKTSRIVDPAKHKIAEFLALEPNRRHTWIEFKEMMIYWGCLTQNAHAVVARDRVGDPLELIPMQTSRVNEKIVGRDVFYDCVAGTMQEQALLGATMMTVPERDMIHVRGRMLDGMYGYSTMVAGKNTLDTGKNLDKFRENLFGEEGQIRGVFIREDADGVMPEEAFTRLRQQFKVLMNKFRQMSEPIVLEGGVKFEPISSNPREMQFVEQFATQVSAICRLLRVPPHKVFSMEGVKYENLETSEKMYVGDTLIPICRRYEERFARALLSREDRSTYFLEFDREEMELRDPARENERVIKSVERGLILIDEGRAKLGYNELPNGQGKTRIIPTNMTVVDENGEVVIAGASTSSGTEKTSEDNSKTDPETSTDDSAKIVQIPKR